MTINASNLITKTAGCPIFGDWAIKNKLTHKWSEAKKGDIVLFDFNNNGTSDHIGIVYEVHSSYILTIEGNTGNGSNTNGDGVYRRKRTKPQVNYFVRPKYDSVVTAQMIIDTAKAEVGYKEGKNNSNKYGAWYGANNQPWCCIFVCWVFAHVKGSTLTEAQELIGHTAGVLAWDYGTPSSKWKYSTGRATKKFKQALEKAYPKRSGWSKPARLGASCDVFVGTVIRATSLDKSFPRGLDDQEKHMKNSNLWKTVDKSKARRGDIILMWHKSGGMHICIITGKYVAEAGFANKYGVICNRKAWSLNSNKQRKILVYRYKG